MEYKIIFKKNKTYVTFTMLITNDRHLTNYLNAMERKGFKEIGIYKS
jgi:hypothetical protein